MVQTQIHDLRSLFAGDIPLLDVRAPIEFSQGAMPAAKNLPILENHEREAVGIEYRQQGPEAAVQLGQRLVSGELREQRIAAWAEWARAHPHGAVYCFRGGSRSAYAQRWLAETGIDRPIVKGGYKAMRRHLMDFLEQDVAGLSFLVFSGRTGSGKTRLLRQFQHAVDLEALAAHRGSAFGRLPGGQPTQIDFENRLAGRLIRMTSPQWTHSPLPILIEDESKLIGQRLVPPLLLQLIRQADQILVEEPLETRVDWIVQEYVVEPIAALVRQGEPEQAFPLQGNRLLSSLQRIRNRLGGVRYHELSQGMQQALADHEKTGSPEAHRAWVRSLLLDYYDPLYAYARQRQKRSRPPLFCGSGLEVRQYLQDQHWKLDAAMMDTSSLPPLADHRVN